MCYFLFRYTNVVVFYIKCAYTLFVIIMLCFSLNHGGDT